MTESRPLVGVQVSEEELETMLDTLASRESNVLDRVRKGAEQELLRRFDDPDMAMTLPGTALLRILQLAAQADIAHQLSRRDGPVPVPCDIIIGAGIPWARKKALLNAEMARLNAQIERIEECLERGGEDGG